MLEKVPEYLRTYAANAEKIRSLYNEQLEVAKKKYQPAAFRDEKARLGVELRGQLDEQKGIAWNACLADLKKAQEQVQKVVAAPIPSDFAGKLQVLQAIKGITRTEADALLGRNLPYLAYRAVCDTVNTPDRIIYNPVSLEDVEGAYNSVNSFLNHVVNHSATDSYWYTAASMGKTALERYDDLFTAFSDGAFDEAGKALAAVTSHGLPVLN